MARALVDTSAIYALLDRSDANHARAKRALRDLRKRGDQPLLTNYIVAETHALLLSRLGPELARKWLSSIVWSVERVAPEDESTATEIICEHDDKTYSYTDATTFAVMRRLRIRTAVTFDRHFAQFGFDVSPAVAR